MDKAEEEQDAAQNVSACDMKQLELLRECSQKRSMIEWNKWREQNPKEEICLRGAHLEKACLNYANLQDADLTLGRLEGAELFNANLEGANLFYANVKEARLWRTNLRRALLGYCHLEGAKLTLVHLEGADLRYGYLEGAILTGGHLEGANLKACIVDGLTLFWGCSVDRKTDFRGVGLNSCRMDEETKSLLQYNRRRMNCEAWYKQHPRLAWPVRGFFWMSDYGRSTGRIIFTFFGLALIFAGIYYLCALVNSPGIVSSLFEGKEGAVPAWLVPFRTVYFSIVTMTTLGFGDMHAHCQSFWGHLLLTVQVILGYVLLAALVTRIGVLFTSGVIPGQFKDSSKKSNKNE